MPERCAMPHSPDPSSALEEILNRLAVEAVLATPGRDEGLIPAYSLLGEIRALCADQPAVLESIDALLPEFEQCLSTAVAFPAPLVGRLRALVEWLPGALAAGSHSTAVAPAAAAAGAGPAPSPADAADALLEFDLGENRELLTEFYGEAVEHLQQIEAALLALERSADDPEALNS